MTMIQLYALLLSAIISSLNFRSSSYYHHVDAFVIRDRSFTIRQRQDQQTTIYHGKNTCNVCWSRRNANKGVDVCNRFIRRSLLSKNTVLFETVATDEEQELNLSQDQATTAKSTEVASSSSSQIEVVVKHHGKSSASISNGVSVGSSKKGNTMTSGDKAALLGKMKKKSVEKDIVDVPRPTANGGYSHTQASRAKISAANKGKTPWNKGKSRSPEVRARIAAGVRARNREIFLKKLEDMGMTEEEYEAKKKEERRIKEAERRARRTENGGYRPTEETKQKISRILKEKHAKGEVKRRAKPDPSKVRRGFTHSEETRKKISASLRKRWQDDEGFQKKMKESFTSREDVRKKISESLKKKWQDPEFRNDMMDKISNRKSGKDAMNYDKEHRKKISEAMKRKWQDASYREKTLTSIQKSAQNRRVSSTPSKPKPKPKAAGIEELRPLKAGEVPQRKTKKKRVTRKKAPTKKIVKIDSDDDGDDDDKDISAVAVVRKPSNHLNKVKGVTSATKVATSIDVSSEDEPPVEKEKKKSRKKEKDGSVTRLREERRDLFDLLYGDEDEMNDNEDADVRTIPSDPSLDRVDMLLGDEDLDAFDPYGLDDY